MNFELVISAVMLGSTALILAAVGEVIIEKSGVLNLAIDGFMAIGAYVAFWAAVKYGTITQTLLAVIISGMVGGTVFWLLVHILRVGQVTIGLAGALLLPELVGELGSASMNQTSLEVQREWMFVSAILLALLAHGLLKKTTLGLNIRAVGEMPETADANGISVGKVRLIAIVIGTTLMALAGSQLLLVMLRGLWSDNIVAGRGWVAYAICVTSGWRPTRVVLISLMIGAAFSAQFWLQGLWIEIPVSILKMLPYLVGLIAWILDRVKQPAALGTNWSASR